MSGKLPAGGDAAVNAVALPTFRLARRYSCAGIFDIDDCADHYRRNGGTVVRLTDPLPPAIAEQFAGAPAVPDVDDFLCINAAGRLDVFTADGHAFVQGPRS